MQIKNYIKILIILQILFISACSSVPKFTSKREKIIPREKIETKNLPELESNFGEIVLESVVGVASYYAHKFHGRLTSNGETYDMYGLTAAHPSYPGDTILRVTNLSNNKSLIIRVNDRMPKRSDRIIDLSLGTAQKLDMVNDGIAEVKLEILKWGDNKYKKQ